MAAQVREELVAAGRATGRRGRFVHDRADGARAASALRVAAEAAVALARRPRRFARTERRAHVAVAQHVAGADDHGSWAFRSSWFPWQLSIYERDRPGKTKIPICSYSNVGFGTGPDIGGRPPFLTPRQLSPITPKNHEPPPPAPPHPPP